MSGIGTGGLGRTVGFGHITVGDTTEAYVFPEEVEVVRFAFKRASSFRSLLTSSLCFKLMTSELEFWLPFGLEED